MITRTSRGDRPIDRPGALVALLIVATLTEAMFMLLAAVWLGRTTRSTVSGATVHG